MGTAISISGLVKRFGPTLALDGLELEVRTGEVHGFLGPNGAGKTTTLRVLLGLLRADAGQVRLLGGDPWRDAVTLHRRLAYVPGDVEGTRVRCQVDADRLDEVLGHLSAAGVRSLTNQPPTLEELFLRHYQTDEQAAATDGQPAREGGRS